MGKNSVVEVYTDLFNVNGEIVVSDPCYTDKKWQLRLNALSGPWSAKVVQGRDGIQSLEAFSESAIPTQEDYDNGMVANLGVDSGQMSVFNAEDFSPENDKWYNDVCECHSLLGYGTFRQAGVVTGTGGDGSFEAFIAERDGKVIGVKIVFDGGGDDYRTGTDNYDDEEW